MKQKVAVRALIQQNGEVLVVRRASGRASILGRYELPGGKIDSTEQPEDALRRYLHDDLGLSVRTMKLYDAVTYIDHDNRDVQYLVVVYMVDLTTLNPQIQLGQKYDEHIWISLKNKQQYQETDLTEFITGIYSQDGLAHIIVNKSTKEQLSDMVTIYSDGGSRGNPGPSAAGFVIMNDDQSVREQGGEYLGITTNNQAEYHGVLLGLQKAHELGLKKIDFRIDSMMVVNQMNNIYKIKNRDLWPVHERILALVQDFDVVKFSHVKREYNQLADGMVNSVLDAHKRNQSE